MTLKFWDLSDGRTELFFNNQDAKGYKRRGHCCLVWFALCFSRAYRFKNAILNKICLSCQLITQVELFN